MQDYIHIKPESYIIPNTLDETNKSYVYGEVNRPGSYVLEKGMTVMQAISVSGGISPKGSYGGVVIKRQDSSGNVTEIEAEESTKLLENDVVFVEESFF